jgi:hypothetical protein
VWNPETCDKFVSRVTGWVCKKIAQSATQPIFGEINT